MPTMTTAQKINSLPLWPLAVPMVAFYAFACAYLISGIFIPDNCVISAWDTVFNPSVCEAGR